MKTVIALLLAMLLCGSAFGADIATLADAKKALASDLAMHTAQLEIKTKYNGGFRMDRPELPLRELLAVAADRDSSQHADALKSLRAAPSFSKAVAAHRAAVSALPQTAETRTYIARVLDPVLSDLAGPPRESLVGNLARLDKELGQSATTLDEVIAKRIGDLGGASRRRTTTGGPFFSLAEIETFYTHLAGADKVVTIRELLSGYAGSDARLNLFVFDWIASAKLGPRIVAALDAEVAAMTKAGNPQASVVRRASEKFAQQLKDNGLRPDAKAAVADALKAWR